MKKKSWISLVLGLGALGLSCSAVGLLNGESAKETAATGTPLALGSSVYAIVPNSWLASSRF
jgi:hypothetical protein